MPRTVSIGCQDFETIRRENCFYVDKTLFIQEWWEQMDSVTLITRPRRFGKTLLMSMVEKFFSMDSTAGENLFQGLKIWEIEEYRKLQGSYPVISLSFASIKEQNYHLARRKICQILSGLYSQYRFLLNGDILDNKEKKFFESVSADMEDVEATLAIQQLSLYLSRYYGKKVIILLDEYDTPMQEAYVDGYREELTVFIRSLLNATFKGNPYLERAILTGITRVSKESVFSDLNNLKVVTTTSSLYGDSFGFTEEEVFKALDEYGLSDKKEEVKRWYDGFIFGSIKDIYNPWSIINYLSEQRVGTYWANTSSNSLIGKLIRQGGRQTKETFRQLLSGGSIEAEIEEQIVYNQLDWDENAVWSLFLASGYLKVKNYKVQQSEYMEWKEIYELNKDKIKNPNLIYPNQSLTLP